MSKKNIPEDWGRVKVNGNQELDLINIIDAALQKTLKEYINTLETRQNLLEKVLKTTENPCRYLELTTSYQIVNNIIKELKTLNKWYLIQKLKRKYVKNVVKK